MGGLLIKYCRCQQDFPIYPLLYLSLIHIFSGDLRHVKIFVSVMGDEAQIVETMAALERAQGFIRSEIGKRIRLRHTPEIVFRHDTSIQHGARVFQLLQEIRKEEGGRE